MQDKIDVHILEMNFLEFLTSFLEGRTPLTMILQINERIYTRDHATLSESLITVSTKLHELKEKVDRKEEQDEETIINIVNDCVLELIAGQEKLYK